MENVHTLVPPALRTILAGQAAAAPASFTWANTSVEVRWDGAQLTLRHQGEQLTLDEGDLITLKLSRGRHRPPPSFWSRHLGLTQQPAPTLILEVVQAQRSLSIQCVATPEQVEGLPWLERAAPMLPASVLLEILGALTSLEARVAPWSEEATATPPHLSDDLALPCLRDAAPLALRWLVTALVTFISAPLLVPLLLLVPIHHRPLEVLGYALLVMLWPLVVLPLWRWALWGRRAWIDASGLHLCGPLRRRRWRWSEIASLAAGPPRQVLAAHMDVQLLVADSPDPILVVRPRQGATFLLRPRWDKGLSLGNLGGLPGPADPRHDAWLAGELQRWGERPRRWLRPLYTLGLLVVLLAPLSLAVRNIVLRPQVETLLLRGEAALEGGDIIVLDQTLATLGGRRLASFFDCRQRWLVLGSAVAQAPLTDAQEQCQSYYFSHGRACDGLYHVPTQASVAALCATLAALAANEALAVAERCALLEKRFSNDAYPPWERILRQRWDCPAPETSRD